jgi:hypothetical protein
MGLSDTLFGAALGCFAMRYQSAPGWVVAAIVFVLLPHQTRAADAARTLLEDLAHLRPEGPREWEEFPEQPDAQRLELTFDAAASEREQTLRLRQQDVKQAWRIELNGKHLGDLHRDENDMVVYFVIPPGTLAESNTLTIEQQPGRRTVPDDIRVGEILLDPRPLSEAIAGSFVEVTVTDADTDRPTPARITILNDRGALQAVAAHNAKTTAVRPGTVYTANGKALLVLPAGTYTILAGRGFEYSLARTTLTVEDGVKIERHLTIRREVPTEGYVACDPHVHTLTHSGHGDASVAERMVTIAAEAIELPIAADHNVQIDHEPFARAVGVREYFTPVIGNEVTTPVGHFNIFPVPAEAEVPKHGLRDWFEIFAEIERATAAPVIILNHARDLHSGVRPFGSTLFNDAVATRLDGSPIGFNAMEVVNSGATQTDVLQLFEDWMALLNRGAQVTPIGSSDSHDVARHFVGQGRTYIRCDDTDPGNIDVAAAIESLRQGRVMVSYGLLATIDVGGRSSGELAPATDEMIRVDVRVLGPHWVTADRVELFMNGSKIREEKVEPSVTDAQSEAPSGIKWTGHWLLPRPSHDVHLVAIARGPGIDGPYWKTAKPYQPTSPAWEPQVIGCSGAVRVDADGDGEWTPAREYARQVWDASQNDLTQLAQRLEEYDVAVATHAADLYQQSGGSVVSDEFRSATQTAAPQVQQGFHGYVEAWRQTQMAGTQPAER